MAPPTWREPSPSPATAGAGQDEINQDQQRRDDRSATGTPAPQGAYQAHQRASSQQQAPPSSAPPPPPFSHHPQHQPQHQYARVLPPMHQEMYYQNQPPFSQMYNGYGRDHQPSTGPYPPEQDGGAGRVPGHPHEFDHPHHSVLPPFLPRNNSVPTEHTQHHDFPPPIRHYSVPNTSTTPYLNPPMYHHYPPPPHHQVRVLPPMMHPQSHGDHPYPSPYFHHNMPPHPDHFRQAWDYNNQHTPYARTLPSGVAQADGATPGGSAAPSPTASNGYHATGGGEGTTPDHSTTTTEDNGHGDNGRQPPLGSVPMPRGRTSSAGSTRSGSGGKVSGWTDAPGGSGGASGNASSSRNGDEEEDVDSSRYTEDDGNFEPGKKARKQRRRKGELPRDHALRKYACEQCDSALATHVLSHTKEKPFICPTCLRGFAVMSNLRRHCRVRKHELPPASSKPSPTSGNQALGWTEEGIGMKSEMGWSDENGRSQSLQLPPNPHEQQAQSNYAYP
ncbi:hypothetical protein T439DRAFT_126079 [Meredithblackwellia eburnea MCA 4105]